MKKRMKWGEILYIIYKACSEGKANTDDLKKMIWNTTFIFSGNFVFNRWNDRECKKLFHSRNCFL